MATNPSARAHLRYAVRVLRDHAKSQESVKLLSELTYDKNLSLESLRAVVERLAPEDQADMLETVERFEFVGGYEDLPDGNAAAVLIRQDAARQQSIRDTNAYFRLQRENGNARFEVGMGGAAAATENQEGRE